MNISFLVSEVRGNLKSSNLFQCVTRRSLKPPIFQGQSFVLQQSSTTLASRTCHRHPCIPNQTFLTKRSRTRPSCTQTLNKNQSKFNLQNIHVIGSIVFQS